MGLRLGKARQTCGFMMEPLERRELLSGAVDGVLDPQPASETVISADVTPPRLATPTSVNITKTFSTSLIVGWTDESASESGHRIERSSDGAVWSIAGTVGPNVTSFHDSGLAPDAVYYYRVCAFDFLSELPSSAITATTSSQLLQLGYSDKGLSNISYNGTTLLDLAVTPYHGFNVYDYKIIKPDGTSTVNPGFAVLSTSWDINTHTLTLNYKWGQVVTQYVQDVDRLNLVITVKNKSTTNTVAGLTILPFILHFPQFPAGWIPGAPQLGYNIDGPTVIPADFHSGMLTAVNDDVVKPLYVGFLTPGINIAHDLQFWVGSTPLWCASGNWTKFDRPIAPGGTDQYTVSLRFGPTGSTPIQLSPDVYASALAQYAFQVNWTDRRPIGSVHLANQVTALNSVKNPRGYFGGTFDVRTKSGRETFRKHLMHSANDSIAVLKKMNAQGMVVWDLEGLQFPKISYVGDPTKLLALAPEMLYRGAVDAYFKKFTDEGLRVGVAIRGQHLRMTSTGWRQLQSRNPAPVLAAKIAYARSHWGATLFYIDSNGWRSLYNAAIFKQLLDTFPDILLIPEHSDTRYHAYTAPYFELRNGITSTTESSLTAYPGAFSVIYTPGGNMDAYHDQILAAVRRGDILMFQGNYDDPINPKVKAIYDEVYPPPAV
jgi:hypothetical protein